MSTITRTNRKTKPQFPMVGPFNRVYFHIPNACNDAFRYRWVCRPELSGDRRYGVLEIDGTVYAVTESLEMNELGKPDPNLPEIRLTMFECPTSPGYSGWTAHVSATTYGVPAPAIVKQPSRYAAVFATTVRLAFAECQR